MKNRKVIKILAIMAIIVSVFVFGAFKSLKYDEMLSKFQPVFEILNYVQKAYYDVEKVDYDKILNETLKGVMKGLDDPFAWYFTPVQTTENEIETKSEYGGIGAVVQYNTEYDCLEVVAPMVDSPAEEAGLLTGDLIFEIDGHLVSETGYYESVNLLRGTPGTEVTVKVMRKGFEEPLTITITRAKIKIKTVKYSSIDYNGWDIGYVRITQFSNPTYEEFQKALYSLIGFDAFIIDLRNNPGGLLSSVLRIASLILPEGKTVITIRDRNGSEEVYRSWGGYFSDLLKDKPIVVLVNGGSASASEILTGALKDHGVATVVGTKTFGKAAVQTVYNLSNGGEIWLPTAHYLTPNGSDIHLKGIEPDITVEATISTNSSSELTVSKVELDPESDVQLKKALEVIEEKLKLK
ncbi:S41 family peptidase [Kosmotoga pacifica]|uniref:Peptidase S41 n=1 Tax=Kosmotoga pacifica TaxID=1330330 RepID=A0A0G2Z7P6_9BACT|nr:S41 family peptidase [Kosmotoga pacifica]AKI97620.1 peptidase S41 [Kosmotoga pacifica]